MAFSKSFQNGQIALSCQMCEESSAIKWKCLTCKSFICSKCCKIHRKVKSSEKHDIVDIKDIALHSTKSQTSPDFTNINCSHHKDQKCCLYCKVCAEIVCPSCVTKLHNTHKMVDISEGYQMSLDKIKERKSEVVEDISKFTSNLSEFDFIKSAERSHLTAEKEKILSREKTLKIAIEQHTKKLLTDLDQKWKRLESTLYDEEIYAVQMTKDLETENKAFTQVLDSKDVSQVFKIASEVKKSKKQHRKQINTNFKRLPLFVPGEITSSSVESIHGILEEPKEQIIQKVQIQVKEKYTTPLLVVDSLVSCEDGTFWMSDVINRIIQNVKLSHGSIHVNKTIQLETRDMAFTPSGDLLLSTAHTNLQIIPRTSGKVNESKFSVSPLITTAVLYVSTTHNEILVGAIDNGPAFLVSGPRQVVVMGMKGKHEVYQYDNKKKPLFTYPCKITTDKDNNIYVIDMLSNMFNGRVVVLEQRGGVRGIYTGHPDVNDTEHMFTPTDIVTTQSDNVIVADTYNHTLHILNNNVQCVQYLNTLHSGIELPWSLYTDNKGFIFIGCNAEKRKSDAKIYVVQLVNST